MKHYDEKRKHKRSEVPLHVDVRLESGVLIDGQTVNISLNGLLFETERYLPIGARVRVYLTHESTQHEHIVCSGEVARLDEWGVAIAFDQIHPDHRETLHRYIRYTVPSESLAHH